MKPRSSSTVKPPTRCNPSPAIRRARVGRSRRSTRSQGSATIQLGATVTPQAVEIRNLGNFTGIYWNDNLGKAQARVNQGKFNVSGEAQGAFADKPNHSTTATFDITTTC